MTTSKDTATFYSSLNEESRKLKKMEDPHFKNVLLFMGVIFALFFVSNDKNFNKIFQKHMIKILFLFTLIYMAYLKFNLIYIALVAGIALLFYTNIGKKLQKNRYIKRIIKIATPYIEAVEDLFASLSEDDDLRCDSQDSKSPMRVDASSIGSNRSGRERKVRFDEDDDDFDIDLEEDDEIQEGKEVKKEVKVRKETRVKKEEETIDFDILDEIRNDMNMKKLHSNDQKEEEIQETRLDEEEEEEARPDAILDHQDVKRLYQELASVKGMLKEME